MSYIIVIQMKDGGEIREKRIKMREIERKTVFNELIKHFIAYED